jgi:HK97 family phage major capsid protein
MDGVINATAENYSLLLGDFSRFVIVDRVGMSVEYIPTLFGASQRPTGQRGWYAYWRTGSDVTDGNAFRLLDIT